MMDRVFQWDPEELSNWHELRQTHFIYIARTDSPKTNIDLSLSLRYIRKQNTLDEREVRVVFTNNIVSLNFRKSNNLLTLSSPNSQRNKNRSDDMNRTLIPLRLIAFPNPHPLSPKTSLVLSGRLLIYSHQLAGRNKILENNVI